jgi:ERCC4-type nuclease
MKEKQSKEDKFVIIRDTREKDGWNFRASSNCHGVESVKLDTGDYSLKGFEHLIMVERKSIADLWGTLTAGKERFMKEMERAKEIPARFLIIEGTVAEINKGFTYSKVDPNYIFGFLISLQVKYGLHVIFAGRKDVAQEYTRRLLAKLFKYCKDGTLCLTNQTKTAD